MDYITNVAELSQVSDEYLINILKLLSGYNNPPQILINEIERRAEENNYNDTQAWLNENDFNELEETREGMIFCGDRQISYFMDKITDIS